MQLTEPSPGGIAGAAFDPAGALTWNGVRYRTILPAAATGGALGIVDSLSPAGSGPPRHVHEAEDETFVVLSGRCAVWIEGRTQPAGPGEAVFVPRGAEHSFRVADDGPSRHLAILSPGGFEGFFAEMAAGGFAVPADMQRINEIAARFHLRFTGPPL